MSRIILATDSSALPAIVTDAAQTPVSAFPANLLPPNPVDVLNISGARTMPEIVIIDADGSGADNALTTAAGFDDRFPGVAILLVSSRPSEIGLAAMRAGVRDILTPDSTVHEFSEVIERARRAVHSQMPTEQTTQPKQPSNHVGRVISVVSPKGGVGKTTVATNLAVGLTKAVAHSTVLVDLDLQFGDVASALNLDSEYTVVDVIRGSATRDTMVLKTFLTQHETGLSVLCAPKSPAEADAVTAEDIRILLKTLASEFSFVVVDTAPGLSESNLSVMDQTTDLVLVTSMDVPGVRGLRKEIDVLDALGTFSHNRHVVLNFDHSRSGISRKDVESTIETGVDVVLPRTPGIEDSVNLGVPLMQNGARDPFLKPFRELVGRFVPAAMVSPDQPKNSIFGFAKRGKKTTPAPDTAPGGRHRLLPGRNK